jgi:hypothetical protein
MKVPLDPVYDLLSLAGFSYTLWLLCHPVSKMSAISALRKTGLLGAADRLLFPQVWPSLIPAGK